MSLILFADDEPHMRRMVSALLRAHGHDVRTAAGGAEALRVVREDNPDLAILDYRMGSPDGLEVCRIIKSDRRLDHVPVLILTAEGSLENRLDGFEAGADDYLPKPFDPRELVARAEALLRLARRGLDRNPTSGLAGGDAIRNELERWRREGRTVAICYLDLDDFKPFSDRFGFHTADEVIRVLGKILKRAARIGGEDTFVGHVGGDDFIILSDPADARNVLGEVRREFARGLLDLLPEEIAERGWYQGEDREGEVRRYPLTRLSAAVLHVPPSRLTELDHLGERVALAKRNAKRAARDQGPSGGVVEYELEELDARYASAEEEKRA